MADDFVSLALTKDERMDRFGHEKDGEYIVDEDSPHFSYGTRLSLGREECEKLGIDPGNLPKPGSKVAIIAIADITSVRFEREEEGEDSVGVEIQIEEMVPLKPIDNDGDEDEDEKTVRGELTAALRRSRDSDDKDK